ncbi:MAG: hypothetical protein ABH885_02690 [Candidatus Omnitrophota bacterium]
MNINIKYLNEKDLFEMQVVDAQLRAHFLLSREVLNKLRLTIEKALVESHKEDKSEEKQ